MFQYLLQLIWTFYRISITQRTSIVTIFSIIVLTNFSNHQHSVNCGSSISFPNIPSHSDFYNSEKWKDFTNINPKPQAQAESQSTNNLEASSLQSNVWIGFQDEIQGQEVDQNYIGSGTFTKSPWQWSSSPTSPMITNTKNSPIERVSNFGDNSPTPSPNDTTHPRTIKFQILDDSRGNGYHSWPHEHGYYYYGHRYNNYNYNNRPGYEWVQLTRGNQTGPAQASTSSGSSATSSTQLQNLYTAGSSNSNYYTTTRYGQPALGGNTPKKQSTSRHFYEYFVPDAYKQKRFRLEIHPGFIAAPIAGLAAFGAAAALTNKPVLVELGLVNRPKPPYGHEKPHHFGPNGHGWGGHGPGHGPPVINHATATATASATVNPVISGPGPGHGPYPYPGNGNGNPYPYPQQPHPNPTPGPSFDNTQFPVLKPIDHGHGQGQGNPLSQTTGTGGDRPWWSPFAAIIPRLRIDDIERD